MIKTKSCFWKNSQPNFLSNIRRYILHLLEDISKFWWSIIPMYHSSKNGRTIVKVLLEDFGAKMKKQTGGKPRQKSWPSVARSATFQFSFFIEKFEIDPLSQVHHTQHFMHVSNFAANLPVGEVSFAKPATSTPSFLTASAIPHLASSLSGVTAFEFPCEQASTIQPATLHCYGTGAKPPPFQAWIPKLSPPASHGQVQPSVLTLYWK